MKSLEMSFAVGVALAATASAQPAQQKQQQPQVDPKADALLHRMSTELANTKTFAFDAQSMTEVVTKDGEKLQMLGGSKVEVQRPNKLRTDRSGAYADASFFYDGKNMTVYGKRANLYATTPAPPNLDQAIDFARDKLQIDAPAADLLSSNPYNVLMSDVVSGKYVGLEPVGGRMCHHLAYRGNATDWQIWIQDGPQALPCRFEITSKDVQGQPEFAVDLSNWRINPPLNAQAFVFNPPRNAGKIDFLAVRERGQQARKEMTR